MVEVYLLLTLTQKRKGGKKTVWLRWYLISAKGLRSEKCYLHISPEIIILSITHIYIANFEYNYHISQLDMILTMHGRHAWKICVHNIFKLHLRSEGAHV